MKKHLLPLAGLLALTALPVKAEPPVNLGEMLATTCFSCHGYDGKATGSSIIPLGDYPASLIVSQMKAYRDGTREGTIMTRHAKGYTDAEIEAMANYIGRQGS